MSPLATVGSSQKSRVFTKPIRIQIDGIGLKAEALCDTGALTKLIMSRKMARRARRELGARVINLPHPIRLNDYRGEPAGQVEQQVVVTLEIDERRFKDQVFWVTNISTDVIIGLNWMA